MPIQFHAPVVEAVKLTEDICSVDFKAEDICSYAVPGQFLHIRCGDTNLLRRPISISDIRDGMITIVFQVRGEGTKWLADRQTGDALDILGPLGNGFDLGGKNIILVGGGIGVPPMLFAARTVAGRATALLGFRDKNGVILGDAFRSLCRNVMITTDDGSCGIHGPVTLPLKKLLEAGGFDSVLACGPKAMLKAVAELCAAGKVPCQVSMEERMGCGIGACLVCACRTVKDGREEMRHVCRDGPVFAASEVVW